MLSPGDVVDRYRIEAVLGRGGMATVYLAHDPRLRRQVALKLVDPEGIDGEVAAARLKREALAVAAFTHPNVVAIYDVGEASDGPFIAMEYVRGSTLRAFVGDPTIELPRKVRWLADITRALAVAHAHDIVHRDVKPGNVMVGDDGVVKVLDFGIARNMTGPRSSLRNQRLRTTRALAAVTEEGVGVGTPRYMAPEQRRGEPVDGRADQFAWGVLAYELLTGRHPWAGVEGTPDAAMPSFEGQPPALRDFDPLVTSSLQDIVLRALCQSAAERFPTMADLLSALEAEAQSGLSAAVMRRPTGSDEEPTVEDGPPRAVARWGRGARRTAGLSVVAFFLVCIVFAGRAVVARRSPDGATHADAAVRPAWTLADGALPIVLIPEIENRTADPVFEHALERVLESALTRSERLYPLADTEVRSFASEVDPTVGALDEAALRRLAARAARPVIGVRGWIAAAGGRYTISISAVDAGSGASIFEDTLEAPSVERVVPTVGLLASGLRRALHDADAEEGPAGEQVGMSASLEADHEYAISRAELDAGRFSDAVAHAERAVAIDAAFALAESTLGALMVDSGRDGDAPPHLERALEHAERLSNRERTEVVAEAHVVDGEFDLAIRDYEQLLQRWPMDREVLRRLAHAYYLSGRVARALETGRLAAASHPRNVIARWNLVTYEVATGDFERADEDAEQVRSDFGALGPHSIRAVADALLGRFDEAARACKSLETISPLSGLLAEADLALYGGRVEDAIAVLSAYEPAGSSPGLAELERSRWAMLAEAKLAKHDTAGAREAGARAALAANVVTLYRAGRVLAAAGSSAQASRIVSRLEQVNGRRALYYSRLLRGDMLRGTGDFAGARVEYGRAGALLDTWLVHAALAGTSLDAGDLAGARAEVTVCCARRGEGAVAFFDDMGTLRYLPVVDDVMARAMPRRRTPTMPGCTSLP